ncbi:hypothetical protein MBAV_000514 [Candidatus Magnetobacterium bavaricum]|uniref:Uncharacterized protein n=1 Tax=Candidatus Magnetobacterium bavaricum TaxID=29290 RepID=A0A0F3GZC3_9BACT|nr:hypothetical protein MBAV_000514 [Candidatus Magnetobacterium bavaricum]
MIICSIKYIGTRLDTRTVIAHACGLETNLEGICLVLVEEIPTAIIRRKTAITGIYAFFIFVGNDVYNTRIRPPAIDHRT